MYLGSQRRNLPIPSRFFPTTRAMSMERWHMGCGRNH